jgi:hypothetical protein
MRDEVPSQENDWTITLRAQDGTPYRCRILDIFAFEDRQYALLLKLDQAATAPGEATTEPPLALMRLIEQDGGSIFQTIASDDEFARVGAHLRERAAS